MPVAVEPAAARARCGAGALERAVGAVVAGDHPRRGALVDVEVAGDLLQLGHDLDRRGAGADHGDPLAGQVDVVVPARRVEELALEVLDAVDVGQPSARRGRRRRRSAWSAVTVRAPIGPVTARPATGAPRPRRRRRTRCRSSNRSSVPDLLGDPADVGLDLRAGGVGAATSRGWARTRTSRAGSGRRRPRPGRCCRARCRRRRGPSRRRGSRARRPPASLIAAHSPAKPAPTMRWSTCWSAERTVMRRRYWRY